MGLISVLDIYSIGIGPSSSHTVGPMRAARRFITELKEREFLEDVSSLTVDLYGSLAMTGIGHATHVAIFLGLEGETPEGVDPDTVPHRIALIEKTKRLHLFGRYAISFDPNKDFQLRKGKRMRYHSNAMRLRALGHNGKVLYSQIFYSIGGGFILSHQEAMAEKEENQTEKKRKLPFPFSTAAELLEHGRREKRCIWQLVLENEKAIRTESELLHGIDRIWKVMCFSLERGLRIRGELPGGLGVQRRAADLYASLLEAEARFSQDPALMMEWVSVFALAVNEENAAGSRVVTAPTNGSAGVIPAVLHYCQKFVPGFNEEKRRQFFLTSAAIGALYKMGASISAAEMGCQGEIGVSSSMAAAGLAAVLGGTNEQIENAAEIAMEHHLGMTCDPPAGLVQIPCIERNAMGAIKAITAARLAMRGNGTHRVSLDAVIRAMKETGENMKGIYKETSEGGLALQIAVSVPVC